MRRLLAIGVAAVALLWPASSASAADRQVAANLNDQRCGAGRTATAATFQITAIDSPPDSITVNTGTPVANVSTFQVELSSLSSRTATYHTELDAPVKSAWAMVPQSWSGRFTMTNLVCDAMPAPSLDPRHIPPNLVVSVTNNTNQFVAYIVTVGRFPEKQLGLNGHETDSLEFGPIGDGTYKVAVAVNGVVQNSTSVTIGALPPTRSSQKPTPTPKRTSASPNASPSRESPSASPSLSSYSNEAEETTETVDTNALGNDSQTQGGSAGFLPLALICCLLSILIGGGLLIWALRRRRREAEGT